MPPADVLRRHWYRVHGATSLGVKLFAPMGVLVVLASGLLGALGFRAQREALTAQYVERARGAAVLFEREFRDAPDLSDVSRIRRYVSDLRARYPEITRITLYAPSGGSYRAVYSTQPGVVGRPADAHDVEPLRTGRHRVHETVEGGTRVLEAVFPLHRDGRVVASVGLYASLGERDRRLRAYVRSAAATAAATLATLLGLLYLSTRITVVDPLRRALSQAEALAAGTLPADLPPIEDPMPARDEVVRFERALDAAVRRAVQDRAQIRALAVTDPLTGLHNRHFFEEVIRREVALAERHGQPFAIAVVDVNGLREVNNRYGHLAGDELLREAAKFLRSHVRAADEVIRWGGDEFLVLMPRTDDVRAAAVARRLLETAAGEEPALGFSIGLGVWRPGRSVEDVLREADAAMYRHKAGSRPDPGPGRSGAPPPTSGPPAPDPGPAGALTAPPPADPADGAG
ncbi:MAG: diguanylate cyclase [Armatimonadota bacterium]|nr:diguanylate cyclase [Armatimonadota bacterium]MDR7404953.1 diguanylate cyclase [Armatimonadota bacterium]